MNLEYIVVLITVPSKEEAESITKTIVEKKLAACVNIVDIVKSVYWWQGKIEEGKELLLIIKTLKSKFKELEKEIKKLHSYTVPEIIALPIVEGFEKYLNWIKESLQ